MLLHSHHFRMPDISWIYVADDVVRDPSVSSWQRANSDGSAQRRPRALVVDDERLIADTMADILEGAGFDVTAAYDGWTALEAAARVRPDYLLSDVSMPRMNGVELAIAMRKMYATTRILLFSGQTGISEILRLGQDQGYDFDLVAKPIHPLTLIAKLKGE